MAIGGRFPPNFIVDTEADRSTSWPDGSFVFCKDTKKAYVLDVATFRPVDPGTATNATNIATNTANIATNASDIADNAADIATNASAISALQALKHSNFYRVTSTQRIETTTWTSVTSLAQSIAASEVWAFKAMLLLTPESSAGGLALGVTGPTSPTTIVHRSHIPNVATIGEVVLHGTTSYDSAPTVNDSPGATNVALIEGVLVNGANSGTLQIRLKCEVGTLYQDVLAGSWARFTKLS